jgi:hypothetical protein
MTELNEIALNNLKLLNNLNHNLKECQLVIEGNKLSKSTDENYDKIVNLRELEYPIYYTFNQILNSIRYSNLYKIEGYSTKDLLYLMDNAIDSIVDMLENTEEDPNYDNFTDIIDNIDEKYIILRDRYESCSIWRITETFNDYLDSICDGLRECNRYLYVSNSISAEEEFNDAIDGHHGVEEEVNKETGEINPNLIYDTDNEDDSENKKDN